MCATPTRVLCKILIAITLLKDGHAQCTNQSIKQWFSGHFQPPETGAKLIDPKMRNSIEFPKWLNSEETKKQLEGKKVLVSAICIRSKFSSNLKTLICIICCAPY